MFNHRIFIYLLWLPVIWASWGLIFLSLSAESKLLICKRFVKKNSGNFLQIQFSMEKKKKKQNTLERLKGKKNSWCIRGVFLISWVPQIFFQMLFSARRWCASTTSCCSHLGEGLCLLCKIISPHNISNNYDKIKISLW